ncbi:MAG TPA: cytochrome c peroxidase [Verrucomicrobiae bacterium]
MRKKLLIVAVVIVAAVLAVPLMNLMIGKPSGTALAAKKASDPALARVVAVFEAKCAHCHVPETPAPFYAKVPGASALIAADIAGGLRAMDLVAELFPGENLKVSEPALAKIEREVNDGEMPPGIYLVAHWTSGLSAADKAAIRDWISRTRAQHHSWPGVTEALRTALIPPIPATLAVDPKKAELGRKLYHDNRLSGDNTVSCATCHDLAKGGTDQEKVSTGVRGQKGGINAPTTFNAAFQFVQFWDGRAPTLEAQAGGPPNNPVEMDSNWPQIIGKLEADAAFAREFKASYPEGFTEKTITDAIATFERTLITPNSRFDKYLGGDTKAVSADELRGFTLFTETGCATCHSGVLLGGGSFEIMGRQSDYFNDRGGASTDADKGRINASKAANDLHKFKVPTLRNVAKTFPYFHDGSTSDLKEAVRVMAKYQCGEALSEGNCASVAAFLATLTGEYQGKPL